MLALVVSGVVGVIVLGTVAFIATLRRGPMKHDIWFIQSRVVMNLRAKNIEKKIDRSKKRTMSLIKEHAEIISAMGDLQGEYSEKQEVERFRKRETGNRAAGPHRN